MLLNVYAPSGSDIDFFKKVVNMMVSETVGLLICGVHLNIHLQAKTTYLHWESPEYKVADQEN